MKTKSKFLKGFLFFIMFLSATACSSSSTSTDSGDTLTVTGSSLATETSDSVSITLPGLSADTTTSGSPTAFTIQLYQVYVGLSADCTDLTLVKDNGDAPESFDMLSSPTLFSATVDAGTYNCLALVISDNMIFTPDTTAAESFPSSCVAGESATFDIYRSDGSDSTTWKDINGDDITAHGTPSAPVADVITFFATTDTSAASTALGLSEFQVGELTGALTVPASVVFYTDFSNQVSENDGHCWLEGGSLGFR